MSWLTKITDVFRRWLTPDNLKRVRASIEAAAPYVPQALEIAKTITALTPTRADDEIVALIERYAVPLVWQGQGDRGTALRDIAALALAKTFPTANASVLHRAIEIAVGAV